jgi:hypothetical protein
VGRGVGEEVGVGVGLAVGATAVAAAGDESGAGVLGPAACAEQAVISSARATAAIRLRIRRASMRSDERNA